MKWIVIKCYVLFGLLKTRSEMSREKCWNTLSAL